MRPRHRSPAGVRAHARRRTPEAYGLVHPPVTDGNPNPGGACPAHISTVALMDVESIARGLVSTVIVEQVETRRKGVVVGAIGAAVVALIVAIVASGILRGLAIFVLLCALGLVAATVMLAWLAAKAVRRIGGPQSLEAHRTTLAAALDRAALPTGPVAALKFAWRLRKGAGAEVDRLRAIVADVSDQLDGTNGDTA